MAAHAQNRSVLHVITDVDRRGAQVAALDLHESLLARGWSSQIVALGPAHEGAATLPVEVLAAHQRSPAAVLGLRRRARCAGVVVAHGSTTLPVAALALVGARPFVYVNIGDPRAWLSTRRRLLQTRLLLRRAAGVAAISPTAAEVLTGLVRVPSERVVVLPNSRPAARFAPLPAVQRHAVRRQLGLPVDRPLVLHLGAASPEKRHDLAISLAERTPGVHVVLAGPPPAAELVERARAAGATVLGAVADPAPLVAASDVVVVTSDTEGLPGVLVEAGLSGVPAVSTDVGFVSDVVVDGVTGRLVPRDDVPALQRAVGECVADRDLWGAAAREHCLARFTPEVVLPGWERLLGQIAGGREGHVDA
jgi:glycosyltransferase involved in cell wall biosynthesis